MLLRLGRSVDLKGSERSATVVDLRDGVGEQVMKSSSAAYRVGKVSLLVGADAIEVVHEKDGLVQKDASVEE
ncbi:hypothetical protein BHE74_00038760 [Ensete ventricosum]|nr:hypothetical protein BHE74_00038760 [Ensete ventricosum]